MRKEKLLVLAKAYPIISKKYETLLCIAGITEEKEWRRIYPVPMEDYIKVGKFQKRRWIEYEIKDEHPERRKESRKIYTNSIKVVGERENNEEIRKILRKKVTTIEELWNKNKEDGTSLGVIKPILERFEVKERAEEQEGKLLGQLTLSGRPAIKIDLIDKWIGYHFKCSDNCKGHICMCVDIEVGSLYRKLKAKNEQNIARKMGHRLFDWMKSRELFFIMGTESHYGEWIIVSLFYPPNENRHL
jgi:hypothetical protein